MDIQVDRDSGCLELCGITKYSEWTCPKVVTSLQPSHVSHVTTETVAQPSRHRLTVRLCLIRNNSSMIQGNCVIRQLQILSITEAGE
jgi:hypothetical protein